MITDKQLTQLANGLKRLFVLPITRSTYREIQNSLLASVQGNPEEANTLFESLVVGDTKIANKITKEKELLSDLIDKFSVSIRVAKEVYERGEFISLASSDIITQMNRVAFLNRIRRVDGEELHFITDTRGTINLLQHLLSRLQELQKNELGKESLLETTEELKSARDRLDQLLGRTPATAKK